MRRKSTALFCIPCVESIESRVLLSGAPVSFTHVTLDSEQIVLRVSKGLADIRGDGTLNPVVGYRGQGIYWYEPSAPGDLADPWTKHTIIDHGDIYETIESYDVNGDGAPDLIAAMDNQMRWFENPRGSGGDPTQPWSTHLIGDGGGHNVALADLDHNGKMDVITQSAIYFQNSPDSWTKLGAPQYDRVNNGVGVFDALGTGNEDVIGYIANSSGTADAVWYENPLDHGGNPQTDVWLTHYIGPGALDSTGDASYTSADFNGDGRPDIVSTQRESSDLGAPPGVIVYLSPADPRAGNWTPVQLDASYIDTHNLELADMDGDGTLDIVTGEQEQSPQDRVAIFYNIGGDAAHWQQQVVATTGSQNPRVGDLNNDGSLDIFGANHGYFGAVNPVEAWIAATPASVTQTPAPPTALVAYAEPSGTQVNLSWTDNSRRRTGFKNPKGTQIERSSDGVNFQQIATVGPSSSLYSDNTVTPGANYTYRVHAYNDAGSSAYSSIAGNAAGGGPVNPGTGTLAGTVFDDLNGNGTLETGESPLAGRTVYLDQNGNGLADAGETTASTDAKGAYSFTGLAPGAYSVRELTLAGWRSTTTATQSVANVVAGQITQVVGLGSRSLADSIVGSVFEDANHNRKFDTGEVGLAGWTVIVTGKVGKKSLRLTLVTDADGDFVADGLTPNKAYTVKVVAKKTYRLTTAGSFSLKAGTAHATSGIRFFGETLRPRKS